MGIKSYWLCTGLLVTTNSLLRQPHDLNPSADFKAEEKRHHYKLDASSNHQFCCIPCYEKNCPFCTTIAKHWQTCCRYRILSWILIHIIMRMINDYVYEYIFKFLFVHRYMCVHVCVDGGLSYHFSTYESSTARLIEHMIWL